MLRANFSALRGVSILGWRYLQAKLNFDVKVGKTVKNTQIKPEFESSFKSQVPIFFNMNQQPKTSITVRISSQGYLNNFADLLNSVLEQANYERQHLIFLYVHIELTVTIFPPQSPESAEIILLGSQEADLCLSKENNTRNPKMGSKQSIVDPTRYHYFFPKLFEGFTCKKNIF